MKKLKKSNVTRRSRRNVTGCRRRGNVTKPRLQEVTLPSRGAQKQKLFRDRQKKYLAALELLEKQVREKEPKKFKAALSSLDEINRERRRYAYYY